MPWYFLLGCLWHNQKCRKETKLLTNLPERALFPLQWDRLLRGGGPWVFAMNFPFIESRNVYFFIVYIRFRSSYKLSVGNIRPLQPNTRVVYTSRFVTNCPPPPPLPVIRDSTLPDSWVGWCAEHLNLENHSFFSHQGRIQKEAAGTLCSYIGTIYFIENSFKIIRSFTEMGVAAVPSNDNMLLLIINHP